jgi:hypothetical protein
MTMSQTPVPPDLSFAPLHLYSAVGAHDDETNRACATTLEAERACSADLERQQAAAANEACCRP